jgi:hypothetical protein
VSGGHGLAAGHEGRRPLFADQALTGIELTSHGDWFGCYQQVGW